VRLKTSSVHLNLNKCLSASSEVFPKNVIFFSMGILGIWKSTSGIFKGYLCNHLLLSTFVPFVESFKAIYGLGGEGKGTSQHCEKNRTAEQ
jgi:hypothetical protein